MKPRLMVSALCVASITLAGCASKVPQPDEYSGFLSDYSQLKEAKSPSGAEVMRWVDPNLDLSRYTAVFIEPTQFYPKPQATTKIPDSTLNGINSYYNQALKRELDFRSPAPPTIALVGLMGMLLGEKLWPMGRQLVSGWLS